MGDKKRYQGSQKRSLALQMVKLKQAFPESKCSIQRNRLAWEGTLQPTGLSARYKAEISCTVNGKPDVWVSGDNIVDHDNIPHKYDIDKGRVNVCLYLPAEHNSSWLFTDTIIPWIIEWLYFYEVWLATGAWLGGGEHPRVKNKSGN